MYIQHGQSTRVAPKQDIDSTKKYVPALLAALDLRFEISHFTPQMRFLSQSFGSLDTQRF